MQLVLLHALPLDASMWVGVDGLHSGATIAPTLYGLGDSMEAWARAVLAMTDGGPLVVVGSSIGGSCALEVAALAPDRVRAVVLVGAKAGHRPEPAVRDEAVALLRRHGIAAAWERHWAPLFGPATDRRIVAAARAIAEKQDVDDVTRGIGVFHGRRDMTDFATRWPGRLVVVCGAEDRTPSPERGRLLAASAVHGEFQVIPDCGHYVALERPRVLREIVDRVVRVS